MQSIALHLVFVDQLFDQEFLQKCWIFQLSCKLHGCLQEEKPVSSRWSLLYSDPPPRLKEVLALEVFLLLEPLSNRPLPSSSMTSLVFLSVWKHITTAKLATVLQAVFAASEAPRKRCWEALRGRPPHSM